MIQYRKNFGGLPKKCTGYEESKIVVVPVPYDGTSSWLKGADQGPQAIIDASAHMELYDIETGSEPYTHGIFTDKPVLEKGPPEKMADYVEKRVSKHISKGKFVALLGGEHSVSIGSVKAHAKQHKNLSVLQIDAHSDLRNEFDGSPYNHACVMARIKEICPIVQVGIRSMDSSEKENMDRQRVFFAHEIMGSDNWMDRAISLLTDNVYITFDLDAFDSSLMPSTGTPEPGGFDWHTATRFLKRVFEKKSVVGFDIVELMPNGNNRAPDFLAALLAYRMMAYRLSGKTK